LEIRPGKGKPSTEFTVLPEPPALSPNTPGLHLTLNAERLGSMDAGTKIYYKNISIGDVQQYHLESLFFASNAYTDNQPVHVKISEPDICVQQCTQEYGNPCQYFCPANVFVIEKNNAGIQLKLNPANCLQCQTCAILDPYKIINWQPPEGGDGPRYEGM